MTAIQIVAGTLKMMLRQGRRNTAAATALPPDGLGIRKGDSYNAADDAS